MQRELKGKELYKMNILGIQCGYNGSVCIVSNGTIVSYAKTGNNMERGITKKTIKEALILDTTEAGVTVLNCVISVRTELIKPEPTL